MTRIVTHHLMNQGSELHRQMLVLMVALTAPLLFGWFASTASAQTVTTQISSREAYVGSPIILQFRIMNASEYQLPELPEIDGCDVESGGSPSQSSQITIINGRRSETRSVTVQYLFIPRREGEFTIPQLTVEVDGVERKTKSFVVSATKSETGDLMFAEISGGKDKVYVGQPLDLKLKILSLIHI